MFTWSRRSHLIRIMRTWSPKEPVVCGLKSYTTRTKYVDREFGGIDQETLHTPVLVKEMIEILQPMQGQVLVDMTFGAGGHSQALLAEQLNLKIFGVDRDPFAHEVANTITKDRPQIIPILARFSEVGERLLTHGYGANSVDGVLFDLGASSMQFDTPDRGFSLSANGPLDMRMDANRFPDQPTAADVVNLSDENSLSQILKKYGEEKLNKKIARAIVESRYSFGKIRTTRQLADIVAGVSFSQPQLDKLARTAHSATRTFQAVRIFVNNELNELYNGLQVAHHILKPGGVCLAISFHSLEDRIVKRHFHGINMDAELNQSLTHRHRNSAYVYSKEDVEEVIAKRWEPISKKVVSPNFKEVDHNPRARSSKLRAAKKLEWHY